MKTFISLLLLPLFTFLVTGCSDDEPQNIEASDICGTWYLTNIRGWEYYEDSKDGKSHFNETFNFNGKGDPVGDNKEDAQKILFTEVKNTTLSVTNFYWGFNENDFLIRLFNEDRIKIGSVKTEYDKVMLQLKESSI